MKLYDAVTPNTLRVRVFLTEKGIDVPRQRVAIIEGGARTPEFLAKNPLGEIPVLELDDGSFLTETIAICRYLEGLHPEPSLLGGTPLEQARIEMWNRRAEIHLFNPVGEFGRHSFEFFKDKVEQVPAYAEASLRAFDKKLTFWNEALADGRPFLAGEAFSVADITAMAPLFVCDMIAKTLPASLTHLKAYEQRLRERPSFAAARV